MRRLFNLVLFLALLCLTACSDKHKSVPGGVVSLSPALTELICHLGQEDRLIARSTACDWPESVKKLPTAGDFAEPELERILAMKPALVISNEFVNPKDADALRQAGIEVELRPCDGFADYREMRTRCGRPGSPSNSIPATVLTTTANGSPSWENCWTARAKRNPS